ncbi:MAG: class I SAM-dependent methyltransferase, partial [Verrucomicrobia bacterium]|nr:class I SAM-dependent methyltransferase [Verrucomicrobiota bacterium]
MASTYRWMENCLALNALQDARTAHLRSLKPHSHILMLGEGPGRLLEVLVHRMPSARFTVVDQSLGMLEQAETAVNASEYDSERIRWVHGDALNLELCEEPFDLVTTPFFLDCFTQDQLTRLIPWIAGNCSSGASWLLADFQIPNQAGWQRTR